jgi:hypothetical protein
VPSKTKLVIWDATGHALLAADVMRLRGEVDLVGFLDDLHPARHNIDFCGAKVLEGGEHLRVLQEVGVSYLIFGFQLLLADPISEAPPG